MHQKKYIFGTLIIPILLFAFSISASFAQTPGTPPQAVCYDFNNVILPQKVLPEKKQFDEKTDALTQQSDVSTPYLIEEGVKNIRIYHARLEQFCDEVLTCEKTGKVPQEDLNLNFQSCASWIDSEIQRQKSRLSTLMINDVNRKKVQFLVNKYKEINQKMRSLLEVVSFVKGKMDSLLSNIGGQCVKNQAPEGA